MADWVKCTLARGDNNAVWVNLEHVVILSPSGSGSKITFAGEMEQITVKEQADEILSGRGA